mmetsp:Transcript_3383/g.11317  ORF Transcript_3383/g.11317 Transcript_3383/m.11317 type:complete len:451 (-) Transcript_3383:119-1471(-)
MAGRRWPAARHRAAERLGPCSRRWVWMDYVSIPQTRGCLNEEELRETAAAQRLAINSIPAYVARANNFWVCAPSGVRHEDGERCDYATWSSRGWCRMEECCLALNNCGDGRPLLVTQPIGQRPRVQVLDSLDRLTVHTQRRTAVLTGRFTCCETGHRRKTADGREECLPCDKVALRPVLSALYETQLATLRSKFEAQPGHAGPFWDVLDASMRGDGTFFKHLLLRMHRQCLLAESLQEPAEGEAPPGSSGMPIGWSKRFEELELRDLEEYVRTWGVDGLEEQREELAVLAAREGHLPMLRYIVERYGAPLRVEPSPVGLTPLQEAARLGCLQVVRYVLQAQGVDHAAINHRSPSTGCSALSDAAMRGHAGVVSLLLAAGAQVDAPRKDGKTALHCAAEQGHAAVVRQLLRAGADPLAREEEGRTPAELAEVWHEDVRAFLLAAEEHQGQS